MPFEQGAPAAHLQDTAPLIANDAPYQSQFERETKDLIQRLIKQADEHHTESDGDTNENSDDPRSVNFIIRPARINGQ